ncbi:MAG: DAK2 domain-containing protein [Streptomycetaceae bacterium]|nr:MAG: DAK2 domain-containing protein [Streptomycetaceae bacterium]
MIAFTTALEKVATALEINSKKFEELDAVAGDGDLGITAGNIAKGLRSGAAVITGDIKTDLMLIGREIARFAPSTFGTLFATGLIRASAGVTDEGALKNVQLAVAAAYEGIAARGKAALGERTLLDALHPASVALNSATDLQAGLNAAGISARAGATATAAMAPKHGRAGWIGERAQGNEDAGATVIAVVFEALAN